MIGKGHVSKTCPANSMHALHEIPTLAQEVLKSVLPIGESSAKHQDFAIWPDADRALDQSFNSAPLLIADETVWARDDRNRPDPRFTIGWSVSAPSPFLDVYLLRDRERVVHLDPEVTHGAFNLRMAK